MIIDEEGGMSRQTPKYKDADTIVPLPTGKKILVFLIYCGCALMILAPFLPFMSAQTFGELRTTNLLSAAGKQGDAYLYFVFSGSIAVAIYFKKRSAAAILSVLPAALWIFHLTHQYNEIHKSFVPVDFRFEIGCTMLLISIALTLIPCFLLSWICKKKTQR